MWSLMVAHTDAALEDPELMAPAAVIAYDRSRTFVVYQAVTDDDLETGYHRRVESHPLVDDGQQMQLPEDSF